MLNKLRNEIHDNAVEKGFWEKEDLFKSILLVISEVCEGVEALRCNKRVGFEWIDYMIEKGFDKDIFESKVKDTFEDEIADTIIRLLDICGHLDIDIDTHIRLKMEYNSSREKLHGKLF